MYDLSQKDNVKSKDEYIITDALIRPWQQNRGWLDFKLDVGVGVA